MCEHVLGLTCYASGLILSGINLVQIIATEALWIWGREILGKLKGGVSLATQSCFAKLFIIYCIWSSNEVGERHNIPTAIHSHWRSVILLGLLILCVLLSFLMSVTAGLVSVVKLFTYSSFIQKVLCRHYRKNVKMWIVKVNHTKSSQWQEYQFCGIMRSWRHWSAKASVTKSFHLFMRIYFKLTSISVWTSKIQY